MKRAITDLMLAHERREEPACYQCGDEIDDEGYDYECTKCGRVLCEECSNRYRGMCEVCEWEDY